MSKMDRRVLQAMLPPFSQHVLLSVVARTTFRPAVDLYAAAPLLIPRTINTSFRPKSRFLNLR